MLLVCMILVLTGCKNDVAELNGEIKEATEFTKEINAEVYVSLDFDMEQLLIMQKLFIKNTWAGTMQIR